MLVECQVAIVDSEGGEDRSEAGAVEDDRAGARHGLPGGLGAVQGVFGLGEVHRGGAVQGGGGPDRAPGDRDPQAADQRAGRSPQEDEGIHHPPGLC